MEIMSRLVAAFVLGSLLFMQPWNCLADDDGFVPIFDGQTLNGWIGEPGAYKVENGAIVCVPGSKGNLLTAKEYVNFVIRFDFKLTAGANNGLGIRCPKKLTGNLHLDGIELQILDHKHEKYANLKPYQAHGSIYGVVSAKRDYLKPLGEWNQQEVTVNGRKVKVVLNGTTIVDADLDEATKNGTLDDQPHPGLARTTGHIGLLGHGDQIEVRHIRLRELP